MSSAPLWLEAASQVAFADLNATDQWVLRLSAMQPADQTEPVTQLTTPVIAANPDGTRLLAFMGGGAGAPQVFALDSWYSANLQA